MARPKPRSELLKRWQNQARLVAPLEIKAVDTDGDDGRTFRGALSTSHLDLGDGREQDIVHPGSFKRWANNFRKDPAGYVPLIDSHNRWSIFNVVGHLLDAEERETGKTLRYELEGGKVLEVKEMFLDTEWRIIDGTDGDRVLDRLRPGSVRKMSMGYDPKRFDHATLANGQRLRNLRELAVSEGSLVVFPMNPLADVDLSTVKGFLDALDSAKLSDDERAELTALQKEIGTLLDGPEPPGASPETLAAFSEKLERLNLARLATRLRSARHSGSLVLDRFDRLNGG